jgi:phosphoglycerate dehydrogenase-like enzyme
MKLAILDDYPKVAAQLADWSRLGPNWEVCVFYRHLVEHEAIAELISFDAIIVMRDRMVLPAQVLLKLPSLRYIGVIGASTRAIDIDAAKSLGIVVTATGANQFGLASTVEVTWGLILAAAKRIPQEHLHIQEGVWQSSIGIALKGKTLGVLGLGRIGTEVAVIARAFGMAVVAWSENLDLARAAALGVEGVSKDELLARSDVLSVHLQLGDRTRSTLNERDFKLMKHGVILVNTARSAIVDHAALMTALATGKIGCAAIDVFDQEPLPEGHCLIGLENVILTPHLGYSSIEHHRQGYQEGLENLLAYAGKAPALLQESAHRFTPVLPNSL